MAIDTENDKQDNRTHTNTHSFNRNPFKITLRIRYDSNYFIRIVVASNKKNGNRRVASHIVYAILHVL